MSPRWERLAAPAPLVGAQLFMDAVLRPHRSLSLAAFKLMLGVVIAINVAIAAVFWLQGAYPVAGFLGLDVLALWIAFRMNYRAARMEERVRVGAEGIEVSRCDPKGRSQYWLAHPLWARVAEEATAVAIRSGKATMRVGAFLSPPERAAFARALNDALWRARRGQSPSTSFIE
jgi:uncharacterized membrane protein